ncbi:F-box and leucine-rich repeat protein 13-like [Symsagittifera roscoffensis]|uniref:F-box and leucine-rich repeat protein 13-like n=1 Tax=Symsagittifera roscoffensis TaxID=84072 RepID=UPI00307C724D
MLPVPEISEEEKEDVYRYIRTHNLTEALEAVLSGLVVTRPPNSIEYIEGNLADLKNLPYNQIKWDMLIPEELRPKQRIAVPNVWDMVFANNQRNSTDDKDVPPELYDRACKHYNQRILRLTFSAVKSFIEITRRLEEEEKRKMLLARNYNHARMCTATFRNWKTWTKDRVGRTKDATERMREVFSNYVQQVIFDSWYSSAVDAKKTREYFQRLESGDKAQQQGGTNRDEDVAGVEDLHAEGEDRVSRLPVEVAAHIFTSLSLQDMAQCALVCRSWKVIIQSSPLWNKVDLSPFGPSLSDKKLINVLTIGRPFVVHLNLQGCNCLSSDGFGFIAQCRNLQDVNFSFTNVTDEAIEDIGFSSGSQMLYLNIANSKISDKALRSISSFMPHLQYLNVGYCPLVTDKGLYHLSKGRLSTQFRHLDLSATLNISAAAYKYVGSSFVNLRSFYCNNNRNIDNQALQLVVKGCRKLRSVSLRMCPALSDESLVQLSTLSFLTWLRLEENSRVSDKTLSAIGDRCSSIRHLYVTDCARITEISMRSFALHRSLVVINLADCIRISDTAVRALVEGASGPIVRELNLTNCIRVTDASILRISQRCTSLRYLSLCHLELLTEASMDFISHIKTLHSLDVTGCNVQDGGLHNLSGCSHRLSQLVLVANTQLSDLGVQKLVSSVPNIESINLSFCVSLSDGAFKNIAYSCRRLTVLGLAGCTLVGDMTLQYISGACPFLTQLDVSGIVDLTDKSLKFIRKGCKRLRVLIMLYCRNMTKGTVSKLKQWIEVVEWSSNIPPPSFKLHLNSVANLVPIPQLPSQPHPHPNNTSHNNPPQLTMTKPVK